MISSLPAELIEYILLHTTKDGPQTVASIAQTCRFFRNLIYESPDQHLWRQMFLSEYDDPRIQLVSPTRFRCHFNWGKALRRRFKAAALLRSSATDLPLIEIIGPLSSAISTSMPLDACAIRSDSLDNDSSQPIYPALPSACRFQELDPSLRSKNMDWLKGVLANGFPAEIARKYIIGNADDLGKDGRSRLFKLLCCTGLSVFSSTDENAKVIDCELQGRLRHWARRKVYNMHYLVRGRHWGPYFTVSSQDSIFRPQCLDETDTDTVDVDLFASFQKHVFGFGDRSDNEQNDCLVPSPNQLFVDWEYLFAVRKVMEANLRDSGIIGRAGVCLDGLIGFDGLRASTPETSRKEPMDWAGVEGVWRRCVCWMDYRDLVFNNIGSNPGRFSDYGLGEAIRIIPFRLRIVSYSEAPAAWPDRPMIHVEGEQSGPLGTNQIRKIHGTVCMTADGEVRYSMYTSKPGDTDGEWMSEGIQIGNLGSAIGVMGMWTGANHLRSDPIGPFWAWKLSV